MSDKHKSCDDPTMCAKAFVDRLMAHRSADVARHSKLSSGEDDEVIGVRMKVVFDLAAEFKGMPLAEVETLLESRIHEARVGAVSVMDKQARAKATPESRRRALYELYLRRHDRIDNWDLVDRAAPWVVGGYLHDKPRDPLYELARSANPWERRTAIVSTYYFVRQGEVDDTFAIAEILLDDEHDLVRKAVGGWLREAGKKDGGRLRAFLDGHAATMPRVTLRFAIEHFSDHERGRYMAMRGSSASISN
jgi:3-methyladenine DNA glycosylase AlkD